MPLLPRLKKGLSEVAYRLAAAAGLQRWWQDEAGPSQAIPQAGASWEPTGRPARQRHASIRGGTATRLTLFRPATGAVQATGVTPTPNTVLPRWLDVERTQALAGLPAAPTPAAERPALAH